MIPLTRRTKGLVGGFLGWTVFVWGIVRLRNILSDDALSVASRNKALLLSTSFWLPALALAVGAGVAVARKTQFPSWVRIGLMGLAAWSVVVWVLRAVDIALTSNRGAAFIVVHVVLGVISIVLAGLLTAELRRPAAGRVAA